MHEYNCQRCGVRVLLVGVEVHPATAWCPECLRRAPELPPDAGGGDNAGLDDPPGWPEADLGDPVG